MNFLLPIIPNLPPFCNPQIPGKRKNHAKTNRTHEQKPPHLALPLGELAKIFDFRLRGAAYRRCQCEPVTLAIDHNLRESPGSLQGGGRMRTGYVCVGRGHAPADHVGSPLHPPSSTAPKPSPSGEGGSPQARRMRGGSAKATTSGKNPTFFTPYQSKIKDFCQLLPREKPNPLRHGLRRATPPIGRGKGSVPPLSMTRLIPWWETHTIGGHPV